MRPKGLLARPICRTFIRLLDPLVDPTRCGPAGAGELHAGMEDLRTLARQVLE